MDARAHGGAQGHALDVLALGGGGFGLDHRLDQTVGIFEQLPVSKLTLPHRHVNDAGLVHAKLHFAGFHFFHRGGDVGGHGAGLRDWASSRAGRALCRAAQPSASCPAWRSRRQNRSSSRPGSWPPSLRRPPSRRRPLRLRAACRRRRSPEPFSICPSPFGRTTVPRTI